METESTPLITESYSKCFIIFLTCMAAIVGLLFGYDTEIVSGSMLLIKDDFKLSSVWKEAIISATVGAAAIFALISGTLVDLLGRKVVIMIASLVFTVGAVVMAISPTDMKEVLLIGRLIVGAGIGFASMSVPVYIAESVPTNIRRSLVTMNQLFIAIGILLSSIVAGAFGNDKENGWRLLLSIPSDDEDTARRIRALLLGCLLQLFAQLSGSNTVIYYSGSILRMSGFPSDIAIWLVCIPFAVNFLFIFIGIYAGLSSFIGIIVALVVLGLGFWFSDIHSPTIAHHLDNSSICHTKYQSCSACIKDDSCGFCWEKHHPDTSGYCLHVYKDYPERYADPVVNFSTHYNELMCNQTNYHTKHYGWANDFCPTDYSWMAVLGLAHFVMSFAPGLGPNPWTINSEIYPLWARGTGNSIATAVNWVANLGVSFSFLTFLEAITPYGIFFMYAGISFVGITLFFLLLETQNRSLEEIENLFMSEEYRVTTDLQRQCMVQSAVLYRDVQHAE